MRLDERMAAREPDSLAGLAGLAGPIALQGHRAKGAGFFYRCPALRDCYR